MNLLFLATDIPDTVVNGSIAASVLATLIWFLRKFVDGSLEHQKDQTTAMREVASSLTDLSGSVRKHMDDNERNAKEIIGKIQCPKS
jgi:hemerythrin-like domain-containing protein